MSEEVTIEEQAAMAVILSDKVKELVREHLKDALEDANFLYSVDVSFLINMLRPALVNKHNPMLRDEVRKVIADQLGKY